MTITEIRRARAAQLDKAEAINAKAETENRDLTPEEQAFFDASMAEAASLGERAARQEAMSVIQAELDTPRPELRGVNEPLPGSESIPLNMPKEAPIHATVGKDRLYDDPFGGYGNGPHSFGRFALDVKQMGSAMGLTPELQRWNNAVRSAAGDGMNAAIGAEGAFLLPSSFGGMLQKETDGFAVVRPRATLVPVTAQQTDFVSLDDTTHATGTVFGGLTAYFPSEEGELTASKPKFCQVSLKLHRMVVLAPITNTMIDWSPMSVDAWLPTMLARVIAWKEDSKFVGGNGANEPAGIMNAAGVIEVPKETGQAATTILYENLISMFARLWAPRTERCVWIANRNCMKQIMTMNISNGLSSTPVYLPTTGASGAPYGTIFGMPVLWSEHAMTLGAAGDIILANLAEYLIGDATSKTRSERSIGLKFDYDQTTFRVVTYTGGVCAWKSALTPANGDSLYPVVKIAVRE